MTGNRRGRISTTKSETRSAALSGRSSGRKGKRDIPRQSQVVGLPARPKVDPNLKPWPNDCVLIVASTPAKVNVAGIREQIVDQYCSDCHVRLAVDSFSIRKGMDMPERCRRPLRFLCTDCFQQYDRSGIDVLCDLRRTDEFPAKISED